MGEESSEDPVKKIFGKTAKEIFNDSKQDHSKFHSSNAFCGNAGPEELKHFYRLLDELTDKEVAELVKNVGISWGGIEATRDENIDVLDEANREDFYREYSKLLDERP